MVPLLAALALAPIIPFSSARSADSQHIYTGGESGAYHTTFCPPLAAALAAEGHKHVCTPSNGTADNMRRIRTNPSDLAFGQLDLLAIEQASQGGSGAFTQIRSDDVRECIFAVARNEALATYGDIAARAEHLQFVLPPANSGTSATFRHLQSIDSDLAAAGDVRYAASVDEAIRLALASDNAVALFVQFPDPDNARFRLVGDLGGHFVPVIDRAILDWKIRGQQIYHAQETEVAEASWLKGGTSLVTSCTPLVLFTGAAERLGDSEAAARHRKLIASLAAWPPDKMRPKGGLIASVLKRTRQLSAGAVEGLVDVSESARQKAKPLLEKAKEATAKALEAAKPHVDSAKESGADTIEKAKETVKELIEPAKPAERPDAN
ncbi:MAG: YtxH domain-containing protein [Hyphomicrobiaceae bacterium]|nr:YtxH domain-containing protein [Hyphomicrobiaceae bacterium]